MNETSVKAAATTRPRRPRVELEPLEPGLDSRYYTDPRVTDFEQQRIFDRTWQLVGHVTDLPHPGSRIVGSVGRREVVVVRTEDGGIRAHLNTCRHRGTRLVAGPGEEKALRCRTTAGPITSTARSSARRRTAPSRAWTSRSCRCSGRVPRCSAG
jgi:Rieske 2Fe-2S family protein